MRRSSGRFSCRGRGAARSVTLPLSDFRETRSAALHTAARSPPPLYRSPYRTPNRSLNEARTSKAKRERGAAVQ